MIRARAFLRQWLAETRQRHAYHRIPIPLRQSPWCANGLHHVCTGFTIPHGQVIDCHCPCHDTASHSAWIRTAPWPALEDDQDDQDQP